MSTEQTAQHHTQHAGQPTSDVGTRTGTAVVQRQSLVAKFASRYSIEADKLLTILKATAFKQGNNDPEVTNEQMAALLVVADQHSLNPFTREIFAFADKFKGIVPVVSLDGWSRIVNEHPQFDGMEFIVPDETVKVQHGGKSGFEWIECVIYRKDRTRPTRVREYLEETYQAPRGERQVHGPWQSHPRRFLRHKAFIQCARLAFSFAGIFDEDEAQRIIDAGAIEGEARRVPADRSATARMTTHLGTGETLTKDARDAQSTAPQQQTAKTDANVVADKETTGAPPSASVIDLAIDSLENQPDEIQKVFNLIAALANEEEKRGLMQRWNARVLAVKGIKAKSEVSADAPKDTGTAAAASTGTVNAAPSAGGNVQAKEKGSPQRLGRVKMQLLEAPDLGCLDEILDLCRGYEWTPDQEKQIKEEGDKRRAALTPQ